jgi:hypothetical protein
MTDTVRASVLDDALAAAGHALDDLSAAEAIELADDLRAVAALPTPSPLDVRLAADLSAAADLIERRAGTG